MKPQSVLMHLLRTTTPALRRTMATASSAPIFAPPTQPFLTLPATCRPHPLLLYGTAWKKTATTSLVATALSAGFQGIDTACQPKHYREDLVGAGLGSFLNSTGTPRGALFVQTKFTAPGGQDLATIPYDPARSRWWRRWSTRHSRACSRSTTAPFA